jgi:serine/threonine-protein kinase
MMRCTHCSQEISEAARFCPHCGGPASSSMTPTEFKEPARGATPTSSSSFSSSVADDSRFPPGTLIAGRYRVVGKLGKGGMGEVFRADDLKLGQPVALKFLPEKLVQNESMLARFHQEVRIARQISHANVCRVYDIGEVDGLHYMSMEYVDGEDLRSLLRRIGRLPGDKALQIARQLCAGLAAAHDKGVLHRDLKPANLMLDGEGTLRITDFGLAGMADQIQGHEIRSGTPTYMAPEQLAGKEVSVASDIYSLGLVLFELFTGKPAYRAESLPELMKKQQEELTSPSSIVQDVDPAVERVILRCLERHPAERPASALAVAAALPGGDPLAAALAAGETPSPELVAAAGASGALSPQVAWACLAGVLVLLALAVGIGGGWRLTDHAELPKHPEVLVAEAANLLRSMGYEDAPLDTAWAFENNQDLLDHLDDSDDAHRWSGLGTGVRSGVVFWYRQSPFALNPIDAGMHMMSNEDPPNLRPGMALIRMDPAGHLLGLQVVPPQSRPEEVASQPDWAPLLKAADLVEGSLQPATPRWTPPVHSDHQQAWDAHPSADPALTIRIEAASLAGRPVFFRVFAPWDQPEEPQAVSAPLIARVGPFLLFIALLISAALLAYRNVRQGRSDRKGAFRLLVAYILVHTVAWALRAMHPADVNGLITGFISSLSSTVWEGVTLYCLYLALEPYVRRRWPDTMISWNRLLAGRFRDPLVGRDVLFGCLAGVTFQLLILPRDALQELLGISALQPWAPNWNRLLGGRFLLGELLDDIAHFIAPPMILVVFVVMLTILLRRQWAGVAGTLILTGLVGLANGNWFVALMFVAGVTVLLLILSRVGLLAGGVFFFVEVLFQQTAVTTDLSSWYLEGTLILCGAVLALAVYGFYRSLGERSLLPSSFLDA